MARLLGLRLALLFATAHLISNLAAAAEPRHVLGEHAFLTSFEIPQPFTDTNANFSFVSSWGNVESRITGLPVELELGSFSPVLRAQASIANRFALILGGSFNVIAGLDRPSIVDYGASTAYSLRIGALGKLLESESATLSLALEVSRPKRLALSPLATLLATVQTVVNVGGPNLSESRTSTEWEPTARFAYGFNRTFGIQTFGGFRFSSIEEDGATTNESRLLLGASLSVDLKSNINFPIGFTANLFRGQVLSGTDADSSTVFALGIHETVGDWFNIGAEVGLSNIRSTDFTVITLIFKNYFN